MFFEYDHPSIRYTGRFAPYAGAMTATALGAHFEIAFRGDFIRLSFDVLTNQQAYPHLWLCLDNGPMFECPLDKYLRVNCSYGEHVLKVILKSSIEVQSRFFHPLVAKISFKGYEADGAGELAPDNRKTIEFIGDSITEGVQTDAFLRSDFGWEQSRSMGDDVTATYAWLTAQNLNLRDLHMGYGAVGVIRDGQGGVPRVGQSYPYCFEGAKVMYDHPDYILINHGANDRHQPEKDFLDAYWAFLETVRSIHPDSVIICLAPFFGVYPEAHAELIRRWNEEKQDNVHFIDASNWVPREPLHPLRDGHQIIAENLTARLKEIIR